tara:strand:- start:20 stop:223 length:204 start_codon:yes stop_codon:yes gene_type:complete
MLELVIFGIGFVLLFEGLVYFIFSKKIKYLYEIMSKVEDEKIRNFSSLLIIIGLCLIYFTFKDILIT